MNLRLSPVFLRSFSAEAGELQWGGPLGEPDFMYEPVSSICKDSSDNFYVVGTYRLREDSVDFNPGPDTHMIHHPFYSQICYVAKFSNLGELIWFYHTEAHNHNGAGWDDFPQGEVGRSHDIEYIHSENAIIFNFDIKGRIDVIYGETDSLWIEAHNYDGDPYSRRVYSECDDHNRG